MEICNLFFCRNWAVGFGTLRSGLGSSARWGYSADWSKLHEIHQQIRFVAGRILCPMVRCWRVAMNNYFLHFLQKWHKQYNFSAGVVTARRWHPSILELPKFWRTWMSRSCWQRWMPLKSRTSPPSTVPLDTRHSKCFERESHTNTRDRGMSMVSESHWTLPHK